MSAWTNHVAIKSPVGSGATHTVNPSAGTVAAGSLFTPTTGRLLVCVTDASASASLPSGWTLGTSAVNVTGLYVWWRVAAGGDTVTTTQNFDHQAIFDIYEFPAGSTWTGAIGATGVTNGGAGPTLTGLSGTTQVYAVAGQNMPSTASLATGTWSAGAELVDVSVAWDSGFAADGYTYGATEITDYAGATASAAWTSTNASPTIERLVWAVVAAVPAPPRDPLQDAPRLWSEVLPGGGEDLWDDSPGFVLLQDLVPATAGSTFALASTTDASAATSAAITLRALVASSTVATANGSSAPQRVLIVASLTATSAAVTTGVSTPTAMASLTATAVATSSTTGTPALRAPLASVTPASAAGSSSPERLGTASPLTSTTTSSSATSSTLSLVATITAATSAVASAAGPVTLRAGIASTSAATAATTSAPIHQAPLTTSTVAAATSSATVTLRAALTATTGAMSDGTSTPGAITAPVLYPLTTTTPAAAGGSATVRLVASVTNTASSTADGASAVALLAAISLTIDAVAESVSIVALIVQLQPGVPAATADGSSAPVIPLPYPDTKQPGLALTVAVTTVRLTVQRGEVTLTTGPGLAHTVPATSITTTTPTTSLEATA